MAKTTFRNTSHMKNSVGHYHKHLVRHNRFGGFGRNFDRLKAVVINFSLGVDSSLFASKIKSNYQNNKDTF